MRRALAILVLAGVPAVAAAQTPLYRSTMPDGKVVVSDRPMPGAAKVEEMKTRAGNYAPGDPVKGGEPGKGGSPGSGRSAALAAAEAELKAAQGAYDAALAAQAKGREEKDGDRIGTAKGGARLSDAYEKRQDALSAEVDAARQRLDAARRRFNDVR